MKYYCYECWKGDYPIGFAYYDTGCFKTPEERQWHIDNILSHYFLKNFRLFEKESEMQTNQVSS